MSIPDETPLFIPDPIDEPILGTSRARANRSRNGDMKVVWIMFGVAGVCCLAYAFYLAMVDTSPEPAATPAKTAVVVPASPTEEDDGSFGDDYVRREALRQRLKERRNRADVPVREPAEKKQQEPAAEVVVEPEPPPIPPDTPGSFDNGSAFDRPAVDSSRQLPRRRNNGEFGTYQAPTPRGRAPNSDRPNRPDPSFDETPADRPMLKKGGRR